MHLIFGMIGWGTEYTLTGRSMTGIRLYRALRAVQSSVKSYSTEGSAKSYRLTDKCAFIQPCQSSSGGSGHDISSDFTFYPHFFDQAECRQLLAMALWKLDRVDTTRKRRRKGAAAESAGSSSGSTDLQSMFQGEYGFEEVSHVSCRFCCACL